MKVLLLRGDNLRHKALSAVLESRCLLSAEVIESKLSPSGVTDSELIRRHLTARDQSERDFFGTYEKRISHRPSIKINNGDLNSIKVLEFVNEQDFDVTVTFGVSILKSELIEALRDKILGIHLGLSPYYRGSGTNFFPIVNSEISAIGYTLMHLNLGIDKGPIIHQGRAPIVLGDSIHSIGNRNMSQMFTDILRLLELNVDFDASVQPESPISKLYRRKDFTEDVLRCALDNLSSGLIIEYLNNEKELNNVFPIVEYNLEQGLSK